LIGRLTAFFAEPIDEEIYGVLGIIRLIDERDIKQSFTDLFNRDIGKRLIPYHQNLTTKASLLVLL